MEAVSALAQRATTHGATILPGVEVFDFETEGKKIRGLHTTRGKFQADHYVLATGAWSAQLGRRLKVRIPMMSGKGLCDHGDRHATITTDSNDVHRKEMRDYAATRVA